MEKPINPTFRSPYYELGDKISELQEAAQKAKDKKLQALALKLRKEHDKVHNHLSKNYRWD